MLFVMARYPRLVDTVKGKSGADLFVIAPAICANPQLVVVHQESGGSITSPKIPFVCDQKHVRNIDLLTLIDEEGWTF